ncbi:MAG: adaptor protein MecA [Defluviitaleaceae bacterium]|nr:adaptor protein MecA [Defluviitaleaceae bacterium]
MRIERISDTQVKFILSESDLNEWDIKIAELPHDPQKTQRLFQEILQQAYAEYAFDAQNMPLMIEATTTSQNQVVIMVTRVANSMQPEAPPPFNMAPFVPPNPQAAPVPTEGLSIFSFKDMDSAALAARRLLTYFIGQSRLYKWDSHYFLVIQEDERALYPLGKVELALFEYGEKHISNGLSENYLKEHGEVLIAYQAVEKLGMYL